VITFEFDSKLDVLSLKVVDIDHANGGSVIAFDKRGRIIKIVAMSDLGDNSVQELLINAERVYKLEVRFRATGGLTDLKLCLP
jgi:hypothetical protein